MKKVLAFDLDDTLAITKSPISDHMAETLTKILDHFDVCVISGGRFEQFELQITSRLHVDAKKLSGLIKEFVIEELDHKNLNLDVRFLEGKMCSTENLAIAIWQQLIPRLPVNIQLHSIKLYETQKIFVEYFGN